MIGNINHNDKRVTIIGAGISGLLIGYALKKKGYQVTIHEKSNRCGGLIQTKNTPFGIVETAAHSILVNDAVKGFLNELGVELLPLNPKSKARYIYRNGKMRRMPLSLLEILSTLFHLIKKPKLLKPFSELTLEEWGNAYLGKAATQFLLSPFTTGVFACMPSELNAAISFPKLLPDSPKRSLIQHLLSQRKKSTSSRGQMMAFKYGTEDLIQKLEAKLKNNIIFNSFITDFESIEGNVILSTPSLEIEYSPLITSTVFYSSDAFDLKPPQGVGFLVPRGENLRTLGCLFNSSAFSNRTTSEQFTSLTVMFGGTSDPSALNLSDSELSEIIHKELQMTLNTKKPPVHIEITRWQRAIPIYSHQLSRHIKSLHQLHSNGCGRLVFTNFSGQVSIRGLIETVVKI
jgi:oxygen-dependent protoporphyrinogen oxidase